MKNAARVLITVLAFHSVGWTEQAKPATDLAAYLEQLQVKLEHTAQRANQPGATGSNVVGLRGSKQEPVSKQLYWKGKAGNQPVTPEEIRLFRSAIEDAKAGKKDQAKATLSSFIEKYPKSGLKADAEDTLKMLASVNP